MQPLIHIYILFTITVYYNKPRPYRYLHFSPSPSPHRSRSSLLRPFTCEYSRTAAGYDHCGRAMRGALHGPPSLHLTGDSGHNCYLPLLVTGLSVAHRSLGSRLLCCWSTFRHVCCYQDLVSSNPLPATMHSLAHVAQSDNDRVPRPYHTYHSAMYRDMHARSRERTHDCLFHRMKSE